MIDAKLVGDAAVIARLGALSPRMRMRLEQAMNELGIDLLGRVKNNLSGAVLKARSGLLRDAQNLTRKDTAAEITRTVGFISSAVQSNSGFQYGKMFELTGAREHIIAANNARALRFQAGGKTVFAKSVHHPGSPVRSFLRSALREMAPEAIADIEAAVLEAVAE